MINQQQPHTLEELASLYKKTGYPEEYFPQFESHYRKTYNELYDDMKKFADETAAEIAAEAAAGIVPEEEEQEKELISDDALFFASKYMDKFIEQIRLGHGKEWAHAIAGCMEWDEEQIINIAYEALESENEELAKKELLHHCRLLGEDEWFEKHYLFLFEAGEGGNNPRETAKEYSELYKQQIAAGKSEVYAHQYADFMSEGMYVQEYCEKYAYAYDKALSEGKDETYANLFADKYGSAFVDYGEREKKEIPEYWEEEVFAYMNGWEYARQNKLPDEFIRIYVIEYLGAVYPDEPNRIPRDRLEAYVLDKALEEYGKIVK